MNTRSNRILMCVCAAAAIIFHTAASASAAVLVEDLVEATGDYTTSNIFGSFSNPTGGASPPDSGSNFWQGSRNSEATIRNGSIRLTAGFGPSYLLEAGTYTLTMYAGGNTSATPGSGRKRWDAVDPFLKTTSGLTELPSKTVLDPYGPLAANPPITGTGFDEVVVQYVVPEGDPLIGEEFTWGFDHTLDYSQGYIASFDWAIVEFEAAAAVPEPQSLVLAILGVLAVVGLMRCRRN